MIYPNDTPHYRRSICAINGTTPTTTPYIPTTQVLNAILLASQTSCLTLLSQTVLPGRGRTVPSDASQSILPSASQSILPDAGQSPSAENGIHTTSNIDLDDWLEPIDPSRPIPQCSTKERPALSFPPPSAAKEPHGDVGSVQLTTHADGSGDVHAGMGVMQCTP